MVFMALSAFSQQSAAQYPLIEQRDSDTLIIFKLEQGRKLAMFNEERKKLQSIVGLQNLELAQKDSVILHQNSIIQSYSEIDQANQVIISEKTKQISMSDTQMKLLSSEAKRQSRYKWFAIISGISATVLTEWLNIRFN
jgi:hypothetical protein